MKRIISNSAINLASQAVSIRGQLAGWIQKVGVQFLESAYSQEMESQADQLGVRLTFAAGYNPEGAVRLFGRLAKLNLSEKQFELGSYFSSHPSFDVRIRNIHHFLHKEQ